MELKRGFEVMALDAADAFYRAPETEDVAVDPPPEDLGRLRAEGKNAGIHWKLKKHMPGRRAAAPDWTDRMAGILTDRTRMNRCEVAPQFCYDPEGK